MKTIMFWLTVIIFIALDLSILDAMFRNDINILDVAIFIILNAVSIIVIRQGKRELLDDKPKV